MISMDTPLPEGPAGMDLKWLLSPFDQGDFVNQYWAKKPLRITRDEPAYNLRLLPEAELEMLLYAASQGRDAVELLSEDDIPQQCRAHAQALEGFRRGKSLRINAVQRYSHGIMVLARKLEEVIHCPVNVNMYLTPGAGKKALDRHYDTHDVFVLQVHGNKMWRLYDPPFPSPLEYVPLQRNEHMREMKRLRLDHDLSARDSCTLTDEFILKAGDCLYLPRGFWHEAESMPGEVSCHLTVGIQPTTYLDVLSVALSKVALSDLRLREQLPFGFATDPSAGRAVAARIAVIVEELPLKLDAEAALDKVAAHAIRTHRTGFQNDLLGGFHNTNDTSLNEESRVRVRNGMRCTVDGDTLPVRMKFGSQIFEITPAYEDACRFIAKTLVFTVSELPGNLTLPEKLALLQQLLTEGLLTTFPANPVDTEPSEPVKWLPIHLDRNTSTIQWLDFGSQPLTRPFFQQSVRQLKREKPTAQRRLTSIDALDELSEELPPSGFIFHISRCGSTLLSNGLRAIRGTVVIAEAQPIGEAVAPLLELVSHLSADDNHHTNAHAHILRGIIRAYGQRRKQGDKALIVKFSSWSILHISAIRKLWPQVPCVILVRDPIEVAVSCLEDPPGWMGWRSQPGIVESLLGWNSEDLTSMSHPSFCARVIGGFLQAASSASSAGCQVLDYSDLDKSMIVQTARLFGMETSDEDLKQIETSLLMYSKDFSGRRVFIGDQESKQAKATQELRKEIKRWAQPAYDNLSCVATPTRERSQLQNL